MYRKISTLSFIQYAVRRILSELPSLGNHVDVRYRNKHHEIKGQK